MFRWIRNILGKKRPTSILRPSYRPSVDNLETRLLPVVGAFTNLPAITPGATFEGVNFDGVARLDKYDAAGNWIGGGTGSLLSSGRHILTAAHVLSNDSGIIDSGFTDVTFQLPTGNETIRVPSTAYRMYPEWDGINIDNSFDHDVALLELPELAPLDAPRYDLYRGSDEVGKVGIIVGYGSFGNGNGEVGITSVSDGMKRFGTNRVDATEYTTSIFSVDFGDPHEYVVFDQDQTGTGWHFELEAMTAPGDSGGPMFLNGQIAAITSGGYATDFSLDSDFGDVGFSTRVSRFADWIDFHTRVSQLTSFTIDMNKQPMGNNGVDDTIEVTRDGDWIDVYINGNHAFADLAYNIRELRIQGSNDSDTIRLPSNLGIGVAVDTLSVNNFDKLILEGSDQYDGVTLTNNLAIIGTLRVSHTGLDWLTVNAYGAMDRFYVTMSGDNQPYLELNGGNDADSFFIYGTATPGAVLNGEGGDDAVGLGSTSYSVSPINGRVRFFGGEGADSLLVNDSGSLLGRAFTVEATLLSKGGLRLVEYDSVANLTLLAGTQRDEITVQSRASATMTTIDGGGGSDLIEVFPSTGGLASIGTLTLKGGDGADDLVLSDAGNPYSSDVSGTYTISNATITRNERLTAKGLTFLWRVVNVGYDSFANVTFKGGSGDDLIRVTGTSATYHVYGRGGNDILIGGAGADHLYGGCGPGEYELDLVGRDILIGGAGIDTLNGGWGDDILIGGSYLYANDNAKLISLRNTWTRFDLDYNTRVSMLRSQLSTATVLDDGVIDAIWGGGDLDWFWGYWNVKYGVSEVKDRNVLGPKEWVN